MFLRGKLRLRGAIMGLVAAIAAAITGGSPAQSATCERTLTAQVVVFDQPLMFNRLGAQNVNGMIYALRRDVVDLATGKTEAAGGALAPGMVTLRPDKRPRPLVLRMRVGDCLKVYFENLLNPVANPFNADHPNLQIDNQVVDRFAGFHPLGLQLAEAISDDGSHVGENSSSLVSPGQLAEYTFYADHEMASLVVSHGATFGGEGSGGNISAGLFGVVTVQPKNARFYRSQVTEEELRLATTGSTAFGQPILNYEARYPAVEPWVSEGKANLPIINILDGTEIVHSDINAIIAGPNPDGRFDADTYPLESQGKRNPTVPNRLEPFREFTVVFHDEVIAAQAFPAWYMDPVLRHTLHSVRDSFMINYGSGGIGSEIIANRLRVGPMYDCLTCAYEEFFLTSYTVGDPAMLVDTPANIGLEACNPALQNCAAVGPKAAMAFYPDDPSNVHHSYIGDFVKFRNLHAGPKEQHIFHLHNHQWLFNANDDNSNYLDAQGIGPGSAYTYEINFGGSGNRNKSAGDAIFHCHFYPHFAQGMWELWRHHDTFEAGTLLAVSGGPTGFHANDGNGDGVPDYALMDGTPAAGARALPDGEILAGTPIPAVVPMPGKPMAPMPASVTVVQRDFDGDGFADSSQASVDRTAVYPATLPDGITPHPLAGILMNPGFPFWVAPIEHTVGQRPTTPPLDMSASEGGWDGGLPRHTLEGYIAGGTSVDTQTRLDFSKVVTTAAPVYFPEEGTDVEQAVMAFHAERTHASEALLTDGTTVAGDFITNGAPPVAGAPYHEPCIDDEGDLFLTGQSGDFFDGAGGMGTIGVPQYGADSPRVYKAANIQLDVVFNKVGYHYPQQRIITLWEDVAPTLNKTRPPEPFVIRLNTFDCAKYLHTNLVPEVYELDDYQVRTPTDIIGQHIHLPKWDLTSADGSANGWNYEDGTLSPGAVRERIEAINHFNDLNNPGTPHLEALPHPFFGAGANGEWLGARTTIQRWFADPVVNVDGVDRGLGIIFTHDHYGPSTHQQIGLYATVLIEPAGSTWVHNETGEEMYTRDDGGPTSWQAAILPPEGSTAEEYREFYLEFSDFQHAYQAGIFVGVDEYGDVAPPDENSFRASINPSYRQQTTPIYPDVFLYPPTCPGGVPRPCPEAISADDPGMLVVNYRNEPVGLRVYDPTKEGPDGKMGSQADGLAGDLAFALATNYQEKGSAPVSITRAIPAMNKSPQQLGFTAQTLNSPGAVGGNDPFTPMMRVHPGDIARVKIQVGGHEEEHNGSVQGMKWLQGGSGFGMAPNSGWRNSQAAGISEQFTLRVPITALPGFKKGKGNLALPQADYAYSVHTGQDGYWSGMWGIMRSYIEAQDDLFRLPGNQNPKPDRVTNGDDFDGACPLSADPREYTLIAIMANELLDNQLNATLVPADDSAIMHVGGPLDPDGGTLVYNPRQTVIPPVTVDGVEFGGGEGPLHDPTALLLVLAGDLEPVPGQKGKACDDNNSRPGVANPACEVQLRPGAPLEPPVLRAAAGECVKVTLFNRLPDMVPDLASLNTLMGVVPRDRDGVQGMTTFHNNLIRPSSHVGLQAQLVASDVTQHGGLNVGTNLVQTVGPVGADGKLSKAITYVWYAGDIAAVPDGEGIQLVGTPVEFGGTNIMPADKMKQGQKGLMAALIIEPEGATWPEALADLDRKRDHQQDDPSVTRATRQSATVTKPNGGGSFRDLAVVIQKGQSHRYADGTAVQNLGGEEAGFSEDSQDMGQMAVNFGSEPLWFRFGVPPHLPFGTAGLGGITTAHEAYSNECCTAGGTAPGSTIGEDPVTPVFAVEPSAETRMRVLIPHGIGRGTTFTVHGHRWQRDPYIAGAVPSQTIGTNPMGMYLGHQESVNGSTHFDLVLGPGGGGFGIEGDYLFRDQAGFGNLSGLWGIMRVKTPSEEVAAQ